MIHIGFIFLIVLLGCYQFGSVFAGDAKQFTHLKIRYSFLTSLFSVSLSVLLVRLVLGKSIFLVQSLPETLLYDGLVLGGAIVCILGISMLRKYMIPRDYEQIRYPIWRHIGSAILKMMLIALFFLGTFFWIGSDWFVDFFGELTPEQFLFNLNSPLKGTSSDMTKFMLHTPTLIVMTTALIFIVILFMRIPNVKSVLKLKLGTLRTVALAGIACMMFIFGVNHSIQTLHLMDVYRAYNEDSKYIQNNYVSPHEVNPRFPQKKRNLIHIYAESMESSYLSKELGGYMEENLMPELYQLSKTGVHFSDNDKMGGSIQTYGSSWSVAGMINMESGVPLKIPMEGNSYGKDGDFLPGIINLGDMLHKEGYNQTIMFGADAEFGGLDVYFTQHGKYHIFDVKEARKQKLIPQDYNVWWGFEDDKLFDYAQKEVTRLYQEGKPFHFNMETADTHFPDGYVSPNLKRSRASQYADVIAYSDAQIVAFVKWIQAQPFYENTTIVITGDHLSMDKNFFKNFDPQYKRAPFNLFLNAKVDTTNTKTKHRQFAPFDIFPTMVASLGVEIPGNRLGLGTNLFANEKTLIERDGLDRFNDEIGLRSNFYNERFIDGRGKRHKGRP